MEQSPLQSHILWCSRSWFCSSDLTTSSAPSLPHACASSNSLLILQSHCVQAGLRLTAAQQQAVVTARAQLVSLVAAIRQKRERVVIALGLALLQNQMVNPRAPSSQNFSRQGKLMIGFAGTGCCRRTAWPWLRQFDVQEFASCVPCSTSVPARSPDRAVSSKLHANQIAACLS